MSSINVAKQNYKVIVAEPSPDTLVSDGTYGFKEYRYSPREEKVYDFRGVVEFDTTSIPFHYKFIVVLD